MARNRRVRKNRKKREQEETRGYVDDLVQENNPAPSWVGSEEDTDLWRTSGEETESNDELDDCCSEADFEETEEEREDLKKLEEGIQESMDPNETDPWTWMVEYDGYDEQFYEDEPNEDDP